MAVHCHCCGHCTLYMLIFIFFFLCTVSFFVIVICCLGCLSVIFTLKLTLLKCMYATGEALKKASSFVFVFFSLSLIFYIALFSSIHVNFINSDLHPSLQNHDGPIDSVKVYDMCCDITIFMLL